LKDNENRTDLYIIEQEDLTEKQKQEEEKTSAVVDTPSKIAPKVWPLP